MGGDIEENGLKYIRWRKYVKITEFFKNFVLLGISIQKYPDVFGITIIDSRILEISDTFYFRTFSILVIEIDKTSTYVYISN